MIVKNASIYNPLYSSYSTKNIRIEKGRIVDDNLSESAMYSEYDQIDLSGKFLYPALIDSHCHLVGTGKSALLPSLESITSREDLSKILRKELDQLVVLRGWDENSLGFIPDREFLDQTNPSNGILLIRKCGHIGTVNSLFIQELELENLNGLDNSSLKKGLLYERGLIEAVRKIKFNQTREKDFFHTGCKTFLHKGITAVHSEDWNLGNIEYMVPFLSQQHEIRLSESICISNKEDLLNFIPLRNKLKSTSFFDVRFIKLYLDGSLGGETAYLLRPYSQKKSKGIVYFSFEELSVLLQIAEIEGISVKIHVIGDGALEIALDAFTKACSPGNPLRHKLVHVQLASTKQLQRILDLNLYVSIQPQFLPSDKKMAPQKIGKARYREIGYPFQKMHEMGINLSFSSDSPIETCNPFQTLASSDPWLNRKTAYSYYTLGSAKSMFLEKSLGSIQTGYLADAFVCSNDIFSMSSSDIETLLPEKIMIHGKWIKE